MSNTENNQPKFKLDINSNSYIPKKFDLTSKPYFPKKNYNMNNNQTNNNTNTDSNLIYQLKNLMNTSKPFIPKSLQNKPTASMAVVKEYFVDDIIPSSNNKIKFDYDYMLSFEKWKISNETKLLTKEVLEHLERFNIVDEEAPKIYNKSNKKKDYRKNDKPKKKEENTDDIKEWGKKDYSKEIELAAKYKKGIDDLRKKDPLRFDLTELLNILTVDNYDSTSQLIYEKIKDEVEYQEKFLDVLFTKAVNEKSFVFLYAKLCKEYDNKLPQRVEKTEKNKNKKPTSQMRTKLLDKCKGIFKIENNEKFDFIKEDDPVEREIKLKKFVLGNVNFIGELINFQVLSKKIVFNCIKNLFQRFEKSSSDELLRLINLEAIVILMDKFGTLLKKSEKKIKADLLDDFNTQTNEILEKLDEVQKEKKLPGHIKYKIINLIERKKNNWEETEFSKSQKAKSHEEIRKEYEHKTSHNIEGDAIPYEQEIVNDKIGKDLINFKDFIEEEDSNGKRINKIENYDWAIVEDIYNIHRNSLSEILSAFIDSCIDFVQNNESLDYSKSYFNILIEYYKSVIKKTEKNKLIDKVLHLIRVARDNSLDCSYLVDVWSNILNTLFKYNIMKMEDLNLLRDLEDEDLSTVFSIIKKSNLSKKNIEKLSLIKNKQELFNNAK